MAAFLSEAGLLQICACYLPCQTLNLCPLELREGFPPYCCRISDDLLAALSLSEMFLQSEINRVKFLAFLKDLGEMLTYARLRFSRMPHVCGARMYASFFQIRACLYVLTSRHKGFTGLPLL